MKKLAGYLLVAAVFVGSSYFLYKEGYIFADYQSISPKEAHRILQHDANVTLLDVRTLQEYNQDGHLVNAMLIPVQELEARINLLLPFKNKKIIIYCRSGNRSVTAAHILSEHGFYVYNIDGGINNWKKEHQPVEKIRLGVPLRRF
jgi:rhodanese-related sulfurtransferase